MHKGFYAVRTMRISRMQGIGMINKARPQNPYDFFTHEKKALGFDEQYRPGQRTGDETSSVGGLQNAPHAMQKETSMIYKFIGIIRGDSPLMNCDVFFVELKINIAFKIIMKFPLQITITSPIYP